MADVQENNPLRQRKQQAAGEDNAAPPGAAMASRGLRQPAARRRGGSLLPALAALAAALLVLRLGLRASSLLQKHMAGKEGQQPQQPVDAPAAASTAPPGARLFTREQLAAFDGEEGRPMLLAILGEVFDVSSKPDFYGKGSGYSHFVAADGTRAFVTGEFDREPRDDINDLSPESIASIVNWRKFYFDTYPYMGKLVGTYYGADGAPTEQLQWAEAQAAEGERLREERAKQKAQYVSCGVQWNEAEGGKVWCDGGRYPRKLFEGMDQGSSTWRCVCMDDVGWSDLLQIYPDCGPEDTTCITAPPSAPAGGAGAEEAAAAA